MSDKNKQSNNSSPGSENDMIANIRREQELREKGYRAQALKIFAPVCAHCGREFQGKRLKELTVHHKDHDHENNPPDGSNWELLCIYCHEYEHTDHDMNGQNSGSGSGKGSLSNSTFKAFQGLEALLKPNKKKE